MIDATNQHHFLGNDIVDLASEQCRLKYTDTRFINRVFSAEESLAIMSAENKDKVLWSIWAAKEAAYKACQKLMTDLIFQHQQFCVSHQSLLLLQEKCDDCPQITGRLHLKATKFMITVQWNFGRDNIHCVAVLRLAQPDFIEWNRINSFIIMKSHHLDVSEMRATLSTAELKSVKNKQSLEVRFFAKKLLVDLGLDPMVEIIRPIITRNDSKCFGPPKLYLHNQIVSKHDISMSHDVSWLAIAVINTD